MKKTIAEDYAFTITVLSVGPGDDPAGFCRMGFEPGDAFACRYDCPAGFCPKTMGKLHALCDAVRADGDLRLLGGSDKMRMVFPCADGPVRFILEGRKLDPAPGTESAEAVYEGPGAAAPINAPIARIGEVCLLTDDVVRLADFYKALLRVDNGSSDAVHQFILMKETSLTIHNNGAVPAGGPQRVQLAFTVRDVDRECERLAAMGVPILDPPTTRPWGARNMHFRDPDGNDVYFRSLPPA